MDGMPGWATAAGRSFAAGREPALLAILDEE
jgi:hypothetical protein